MVTSKPIWRDEIIVLEASALTEKVAYQIYAGTPSVKVYEGVAYRRPGVDDFPIRINPIISARLFQKFPKFGGYNYIESLESDVRVTDGTNEYATSLRLDWSFDESFDPNDNGGVLSSPIRGEVSPMQKMVFTKVGDSVETKITVRKNDGSEEVIPLDYARPFNYSYAVPKYAVSISVNGITYKVVAGCDNYCMYYVNAYGGWDSLLFRGHVVRADGYSRKTYKCNYDNSVPLSAGTVSYLNEITRKYEMHTGWLLGDAGERMHHLLGSSSVYLHDFATDEIVPVIITDNECRYMNYHNNGNRLVDFTVNVEVARDYRRE